MIQLGTKVRDTITGVTGIVIARTEWLQGCARVTIQPQELKDGKPVDATTVDEPQCEIIGSKHPHRKAEPAFTGGPQNDPSPRPSPTR